MEFIIDELGFEVASSLDDNHPKECQTLQNCALASRSLRSRATHWLFFRASLEGKRGEEMWIQKRLDKFLKILVNNPPIGRSIRELFIVTAYKADHEIWLQDNTTLISVLERLSQVQRFDLQPRYEFMRWETLPPKTATALQSIILSPSLRKLGLHTIRDFPWFMLNGCRRLKHLSLIWVRISRRDFTAPVHAATADIAPILVSAYISALPSAGDLEFLLSNHLAAKMFSGLRALSLELHSSETETAVNLIIQISHTLETLDIIGITDQSSTYNREPLSFPVSCRRLLTAP